MQINLLKIIIQNRGDLIIKKELIFDLTFDEALDKLFNHEGWIQGEDFRYDTYFGLEDDIVTTETLYENELFPRVGYRIMLTKRVKNQKYRLIKVRNYKNVTMGRKI